MKSFFRCNTGTAIIELALAIPLILMLLAGMVELSRFAIIQMKLDKATNSLADFVTQGTTVRQSDLLGFANTMPQIMKPFSYTGGTVIFSSVATNQGNNGPCNAPNKTCVAWQNRPIGSDGSQIGAPPNTPLLPTNFAPQRGQDAIVVEVYYNFAPLLPLSPRIIPSLVARKIYKIAIVKPRQGTLTTLQPN